NRILLALGDHADEIADADDGDEAGDITHGGFVDCDQAGADERSGIDAGIGRANYTAVQHAGQADIVHEGQFARGFGGKIDARHRLADDGVVADGLDGDVILKLEANSLAADQLAIADAAIAASHEAVFDLEFSL